MNRNEVARLKLDGAKDEELYRLLLKAQCNALSRTMPLLFDPVGRPSELLLPRSLLHTSSLVRGLVNGVEESAWQHIETIGWLYQFYISERKDEVIGKVIKPEDIPAATQLFTPNWIVKYLVQNSLGATWLATYPNSPLARHMAYYIAPAKQSEDVEATLAAVTPSTLNPEEVTLLDPAVGSGHILVEAYDLFKSIYLERGYRKREIPRLILEKNLYGLDIDPRAAQLASFSLLMKGLADDPGLLEQPLKLNVMAFADSSDLDVDRLEGDISLADFGLARFDLLALKELFMHASTLGSLIQVPAAVGGKIPNLARLCALQSTDAFLSDAIRRLGQLVAQAQVLSHRHSAVVANPPYMGSRHMNAVLKRYVRSKYSDARRDLFACFMQRGFSLATAGGFCAMVTMQSWMFLSSFQGFRKWLLGKVVLRSMAHLGARAFGSISGEVVQITAFAIQWLSVPGYAPVFLRLLSGDEYGKNQALRERRGKYEGAIQTDFKKIPGCPIVYWISDRFRNVFWEGTALGELVDARQGLATANNDRFLRRWWEVDLGRIGFGMKDRSEALRSGKKWFPYNKGGAFRKWYGNHEYVVNWENDGREIRAFGTESGGRARSRVQNDEYYFKPSLTWSLLTSGPTAFRLQGDGSVHDVSGMSAFGASSVDAVLIAGYCNSPIARLAARAINPTMSFQIGDFQKIPFLEIVAEALKAPTVQRVRELMRYGRDDWGAFEMSWNFQSSPILPAFKGRAITIEGCFDEWLKRNRDAVDDTLRLEEENNRLFIEAYGLSDELSPDVPLEEVTLTVNPAYRYKRSLAASERRDRFKRDTMAELVSYAVGCMMGRFSLDQPGLAYAGSCSVGFDAERYVTFPTDDDGIVPITKEAWFGDDAANRLVEFISVAWAAANLEENLQFVADSLAPKKNESSRDTIRRYLATGFYRDHLVTYKKRPIYWLVSSGRQRTFQCLVYLHRYHEGTLARMRSDYLLPLLGMMASRLRRLDEESAKIGTGGEASSRVTKAHLRRLGKERGQLLKDLAELKAFDVKLRHFADLRIRLDLDDGVKVNYGKFGDLLAAVRQVTGRKPTPWN